MIEEELQQEIKALTVPKIEMVTREGKPASIDDYDSFMQFLMLASIASQAVKIRRYFEDRESDGWIENFEAAVPSDSPAQEFQLTEPAQSISLRNNGDYRPGTVPALVLIAWNRRHSTKTILNPNETCDIDFETHKLYRFYAQASPAGAIANIRAVAKG